MVVVETCRRLLLEFPMRSTDDGPDHSVRSAVEQLVVQHAQRQSVHLSVGTARLVPLDVRRFKAKFAITQTHVVAADSTAVLVSGQNTLRNSGSGCRRRETV